MSDNMESFVKMADLVSRIHIEAQVTPALKRIVTELASLGFDVSSRPAALNVASLMANGFDQFLGNMDDAQWAQTYREIVGQTGGNEYINLSPGYEVNPKLIGRDILKTLADLSGRGFDISTVDKALAVIPQLHEELGVLSEPEYQGLLQMAGVRPMATMARILIAQAVGDAAAGLLEKLLNIGFRVWDYPTAQKALAQLSHNPLAQELAAVQPADWKNLVSEVSQKPALSKQPAAPQQAPSKSMQEFSKYWYDQTMGRGKDVPQPMPDVPAQTPAITDEAPAAPAPDLSTAKITFPQGTRGNAGFQYMVDNYNEVVAKMPPGIQAVPFGDGVPVGVLPETKALGSGPTKAVKGGQFVRTYVEPQYVAMVVGYTPDGKIAVRTSSGDMKLVDPIKDQVRYSTSQFSPR